jgi:hypothetical protein
VSVGMITCEWRRTPGVCDRLIRRLASALMAAKLSAARSSISHGSHVGRAAVRLVLDTRRHALAWQRAGALYDALRHGALLTDTLPTLRARQAPVGQKTAAGSRGIRDALYRDPPRNSCIAILPDWYPNARDIALNAPHRFASVPNSGSARLISPARR